jgi:N-acetylglucosaminylphosphatidylinositol deacetylase
MTINWHPRLISNLLSSIFSPKMATISAKVAPQATIDVIITFDSQGVSDHPNHKSLYFGSLAFLKALMHRHSGWDCPISLYTLTSTNVFRKYIGVLDAPATILACVFRKKEIGNLPTPVLSVSGIGGYWTARQAMTEAHKSQMRWFRWGWISLGRYMFINDLKKQKVV